MDVKSFVQQILLADPLFIATISTSKSINAELLAIGVTDSLGTAVFQQVVKPMKCRAWPSVEKLSRITRQSVADKPSFFDIEPRLMSLLNGRCLVAWSASHEKRTLARAATMWGALGLSLFVHDFDMRDMAMIYSKSINHRLEKLTDVCSRLGIESTPSDMGDPIAQCRLVIQVANSLVDGVAAQHSKKFD